MKSKKQAVAKRKIPTLLKVLLAVLSAWVCATKAQQMIVPQPQSSYSTTPPAVYDEETNNQMDVFNSNPSAANSLADEPFHWGLLTLRPHVFYSLTYGDGLESSPSNHQSTAINEISPGMLINIGRHWTLDYTPTLKYYSNRHFQDSLDQSVVLTGGTSYGDWTFGISQSYASTSDPQVETATQTPTETYSTALNASWQFGDQMSVDFNLQQDFQFTSQPVGLGGTNSQFNSFQNLEENTREWSTLEWLNYQFAPRLDAGIGAGVGYVSVETGPDQTYEQLRGRVNWRATDKISFEVNAGFEDRQFQTGGEGDLFNPLFGAAIQYQPFEQTRISLDASRSVVPSYFQDQVQENTSVSADLNQRLLQKFYFDLSVGYTSVDYEGTTGLGGSRTDNYYFLNARLSHPFLKRGTLAIFYQHTENSSSQRGFGYSSNQVGLEVGYSY
jgi:Putative beta-barrel porin 2